MNEERIKKDVVDQLYWDNRIDASQIEVEVNDGRVTLEGSVPTIMTRQTAEMDAFTVLGVTSVENNLEVKYPGHIPLPTDQEIEANIKSLLQWNPDIDTSNIDILCSGRQVILEGSVDAYWKKYRAEDLASTMAGIAGVTNRLSVVPSKSLLDEWIAEDIQNAFARNAAVYPETIEVKVENGNVTLSGRVSSIGEHRAAQDIVAHTAGVVSVHNHLVLKGRT